MSRGRLSRGRLALVVVALLLVVVAVRRPRPAAPPQHASQPPRAAGSALRQLEALPVLPIRPHHAGYQRDCGRGRACSFGPAWTDNTTAPGGHNGCDSRNDVLRAQLVDVAYRTGSRCVVVAGTLHDPYTGSSIPFTRQHASAVQIDHLVPLALAWDLGAYAWPQARRAAYANDEHLVLLAVDDAANEAKGDGGPSTWMPPNPAYRATYAERFVAVLAGYHLPLIAADKTVLAKVLKSAGQSGKPS